MPMNKINAKMEKITKCGIVEGEVLFLTFKVDYFPHKYTCAVMKHICLWETSHACSPWCKYVLPVLSLPLDLFTQGLGRAHRCWTQSWPSASVWAPSKVWRPTFFGWTLLKTCPLGATCWWRDATMQLNSYRRSPQVHLTHFSLYYHFHMLQWN